MYLVVKFHDNDFTFPLIEALEELWEKTRSNNSSYTFSEKSGKRTQAFVNADEVFTNLHKAGHLVPLIKRLWVTKTLAREVEHMTRSIDEHGVNKYFIADWVEKDTPVEDTYTEYFDFDIEIRKDRDNENQNGEHGWLNLITGDAWTQ